MDAIAKFQEALELVKEHGGGSASLREEIEELQAQEAELEEAKEELKGEFEEICRTYLAMEDEMAEYDQLKENLQAAADALGIENANLKALIESHGDLDEEVEILQVEVQSYQDALEPMQAELDRLEAENESVGEKYRKYRRKLKKLENWPESFETMMIHLI